MSSSELENSHLPLVTGRRGTELMPRTRTSKVMVTLSPAPRQEDIGKQCKNFPRLPEHSEQGQGQEMIPNARGHLTERDRSCPSAPNAADNWGSEQPRGGSVWSWDCTKAPPRGPGQTPPVWYLGHLNARPDPGLTPQAGKVQKRQICGGQKAGAVARGEGGGRRG